MNIRSKTLLANALSSRPRAATLAFAAALLWLGAPAAQAQWFSSDSALPATQVERMVQASGYRLTSPVIRNGPVYLADVLGREDDPERLVIEASSGRLLQRYRASARQQRFVANDYWSGQQRQRPAAGWFDREDDFAPQRQQQPYAANDWQRQQPAQSQGGWFGRDEEVNPPRPPARIGATGADGYRAQPTAPPRAPAAGNVARADDGSAPYVILAPDSAPGAREIPLEKPRLKPQVRRKKPEPSPVAQPAIVPNGAQPTPVAQPAAGPAAVKPTPVAQPARPPSIAAPPRTEAAKEPAVAAPHVGDAKPAAPVRTEAAKEPAVVPPHVTDTKAATPPRTEAAKETPAAAPHVGDAKAAAPPQTVAVAPAPKTPAHKPAVNDVPVDPLE
jgi:hypothetical protein